MDIREIDGLWCDDITFCNEDCGWKSCPRNKRNIRDKAVPHSFSVDIPSDCPKYGNAEKCVFCGAVIPEGRQVCPNCEKERMNHAWR